MKDSEKTKEQINDEIQQLIKQRDDAIRETEQLKSRLNPISSLKKTIIVLFAAIFRRKSLAKLDYQNKSEIALVKLISVIVLTAVVIFLLYSNDCWFEFEKICCNLFMPTTIYLMVKFDFYLDEVLEANGLYASRSITTLPICLFFLGFYFLIDYNEVIITVMILLAFLNVILDLMFVTKHLFDK